MQAATWAPPLCGPFFTAGPPQGKSAPMGAASPKGAAWGSFHLLRLMNMKRPTLLQGLAILAAIGLLLRLLLSRYTA